VTLGLASLSLHAQQPAAAPPAASKPYSAPRTPWGDPDLQGNYTNVYENGTPLERPDQFAGRNLDDITGTELREIKEAARQRTIEAFNTPINAPDNWWQPALALGKGSQAWLVVDPKDGKIPPLTPEAQKRIAARAAARKTSGRGEADSWTDRSLYDRCLTRGLPGSMMPAIYGNSYEILQSPDFVAIRYEMIHETRVIPLDGRAHIGQRIHEYLGDARGHFEGSTLVVETTNFTDKTHMGYNNRYNSEKYKLVERFTPVSPTRLQWQVTIDDPDTWTRPWTFTMPLTRDDTQPVFEYGCHEGNLGLEHILSAARAEERAAGRR